MPIPLRARVLKTYSVSLTTGTQVQATEIIEPVEGVRGLNIDLTVTAAGTLVTAAKVTAAINKIVVTDRAGKTILDVPGTELPVLYQQMNGSGKYVTPDTATQDTAKYFRILLPLPIKLADQPAKIQVTFAPYSVLATSGCTGATVVLVVRSDYGPVTDTVRIYRKSLALSTGDNALGYQMNDGVKTVNLFGIIGTESNITDITLSSDGAMDELSKMPLQYFIDKETTSYLSGHTSLSFNLFTAPFLWQIAKTKLGVNATADTLVLYQVGLN